VPPLNFAVRRHLSLLLEFRLTGTGWAEVHIGQGDRSAVITASYLSNALGDLVLSAIAAMSLFRRVTFSFEEEPGERRWVITSPRINEIDIQILSFPSRWNDSTDESGELMFQARCLPVIYAEAVFEAASRILEQYGEVGYLAQWVEHPFPIARLRDLEQLLRRERRDGVA
jgi:hypothetical protein